MRLEENKDYASKGWAVLNTVLGSIGAAGTTGILGNVGGVLGGGCGENVPVSRYDAAKDAEIARLNTEIKLRDSNIYTDQKITDSYERLSNRISCLEAQSNAQAVFNASVNSTLTCIQGQVNELMALTSRYVQSEKVCPPPMPLYNSWTAPTTTTTT